MIIIAILGIIRILVAIEVRIKEPRKTAKAKITPTRSDDFQIFSNFLESY